jgi:phospholipase/carboxylesterase
MSWALALSPSLPPPAGVIALSGFVPRVAGWPLDPPRLRGVPVGIAHGTLDPIISVDFGREANELLTAAGASVVWQETRYPHGVDPAWLVSLRDLVARAVP